MRKLSIVLILILLSSLLFGCANQSSSCLDTLIAKAQNINVISYDMLTLITYIDQDGVEYTITGEGKTFLNEQKFRIENNINDRLSTIIAFDDKDLWSLEPESKIAYKIPQKREKGMLASEWAYESRENIKVIAEEVFDGFECTVIEIEKDKQEPNHKLWIRNDIGMPIKIETGLPGGNSVLLIKNINTQPLSNDLFEIPDNYKIINSIFDSIN